MGRLNNAEFLSQMAELLTNNGGESSVYFTQKRLTPAMNTEEDENTNKINDLPSNVIQTEKFPENKTEYPVLIRVAMNTNRRAKLKTKISTVVEIDQIDQFWIEYAQIMKSGFVGLKKKDKKKSKKGKVSK